MVMSHATATVRGQPSLRKVLRRAEVMRLTGLSATTLWRLEREGAFPRRVQLGARSCGWFEDEVQGWLDTRERSPNATPSNGAAGEEIAPERPRWRRAGVAPG